MEKEYISVPKLSTYAYLKAEITNGASLPLLAGKGNVFLGPNFVGNSRIKNIAPSEKFDVFFGIDEAIKIKREEMQKHKEALLMGKNRMTHRYKIKLENFKKETQKIHVYEQLPVSKEEEIKIKVLECKPEPKEQKEDGKIEWVIDLAPKEKAECVFDFQIDYPKDKEVSGL